MRSEEQQRFAIALNLPSSPATALQREGIVDIAPTIDTKSVLITPFFSKGRGDGETGRRGDGEKLAAEVEKGVYEADLV